MTFFFALVCSLVAVNGPGGTWGFLWQAELDARNSSRIGETCAALPYVSSVVQMALTLRVLMAVLKDSRTPPLRFDNETPHFLYDFLSLPRGMMGNLCFVSGLMLFILATSLSIFTSIERLILGLCIA